MSHLFQYLENGFWGGIALLRGGFEQGNGKPFPKLETAHVHKTHFLFLLGTKVSFSQHDFKKPLSVNAGTQWLLSSTK